MRHAATAVAVAAIVTAGCMPAPGTSTTPEAGSPLPSSILDPYLEIQNELVNESIENLRANAGNIATAASGLGSPAVRIDLAAVQLASAAALPDAREKFGRLSDAIISYMDGLDLSPPDGVQVAMCEATRQQWLQEGSTISNPYGSSACGSFR